jgi:DNA-binding MarR family transcriptional regulator
VDDLPERLASTPTFLVTQLATHAHRLAGESFERAGARGYHYRVLAALADRGPQSQADLGRRVNMDRSDIAGAVDDLVAAGQVERRVDPADARRRIVRLTPAGRRQVNRLDRSLAAAQDEFLAPLDGTQRAAFTALASALLSHHASAARDRG